MLRIILISLVFAICSTCLVRPWFWKAVKRREMLKVGRTIGFTTEHWKFEVTIEILTFVITFAAGIVLFISIGCRQNIYGIFLLIILCALFQCIWDHQPRRFYIKMVIIMFLSAALWIQDGFSKIEIRLNNVESVPITATEGNKDFNIKYFISNDEIRSLFKADWAEGPTYNNGKYIYIAKGRDLGYGVIVIDTDDYSEAKFIQCNYKADVTELRHVYPTEKLEELYVTCSDENIPYCLFAVAEKTWLLGKYDVTGYVMLNLQSGESKFFAEEDLPEFVTNNG